MSLDAIYNNLPRLNSNSIIWDMGHGTSDMSLELAVNQSTLIDPFISIIVTVYNKQGTLNTLLNTLSDIDLGLDHEVIIVNDASTDNSEQIIQSLCKQHSHFKYFCLDQNLGAGNARNVGAKIATGKYLCFFDADDDCHMPALIDLKQQLTAQRFPDVAITNYERRFYGEKHTQYKFHKNYLGLHSGLEALHLRLNKVICPSPWNKVYKRDYWEKNKFLWPSMRHSEDIAIVCNLIGCASTVLISDTSYYIYNINDSSLTRDLTSKKVDCVMEALDHMQDCVQSIPNIDTILHLNNRMNRCAYAHLRYFLKINIDSMPPTTIAYTCEKIIDYNQRYNVAFDFFIKEFDGYKLIKLMQHHIRKHRLNINLLDDFDPIKQLQVKMVQHTPIKIGVWKKRKPSRFFS